MEGRNGNSKDPNKHLQVIEWYTDLIVCMAKAIHTMRSVYCAQQPISYRCLYQTGIRRYFVNECNSVITALNTWLNILNCNTKGLTPLVLINNYNKPFNKQLSKACTNPKLPKIIQGLPKRQSWYSLIHLGARNTRTWIEILSCILVHFLHWQGDLLTSKRQHLNLNQEKG